MGGPASVSAPIVSIVGLSGSGKTTLVVKLVGLFSRRGLRVATVKHSRHPHPLDAPGKDSRRHKEAGAERVIFIGPGALQLVTDLADEPTPDDLSNTYLNGMDLIIVEGFIQSGAEKIEIVRSGRSKGPVSTPADGLIAIATDLKPNEVEGHGVPLLDLNDEEAVADFITSRFLTHAAVSPPPSSRPSPSGGIKKT